MSDGLISFVIFGTIVALVISFLIALEFSKVAEEKGYNGTKYLWICFFLGITGYLLVIALPNHKNSGTTVEDNSQELTELPEL